MAWTRSTTDKRGYGWRHQQLRDRWRPLVAAGGVDCWRCGDWIRPGTPWHLGHDDHDRRVYRGPEHKSCNLTAAARQGRTRRTAKAADPDPTPFTEW